MKLSKTLAAVLLAAGALLLSPSARAQTNTPPTPPTPPRGNRPSNIDAQMSFLGRQLTLTEDQKPKVKAVLEEQAKKMQEVPGDELTTKVPQIRQETTEKLKGILTAEQFAKYQTITNRRPPHPPAAPGNAGEKKPNAAPPQ